MKHLRKSLLITILSFIILSLGYSEELEKKASFGYKFGYSQDLTKTQKVHFIDRATKLKNDHYFNVELTFKSIEGELEDGARMGGDMTFIFSIYKRNNLFTFMDTPKKPDEPKLKVGELWEKVKKRQTLLEKAFGPKKEKPNN